MLLIVKFLLSYCGPECIYFAAMLCEWSENTLTGSAFAMISTTIGVALASIKK
jgi:hypothetical protein